MSTFTDEITQLLTEKGLFLAVTVSTALLSEDWGVCALATCAVSSSLFPCSQAVPQALPATQEGLWECQLFYSSDHYATESLTNVLSGIWVS